MKVHVGKLIRRAVKTSGRTLKDIGNEMGKTDKSIGQDYHKAHLSTHVIERYEEALGVDLFGQIHELKHPTENGQQEVSVRKAPSTVSVDLKILNGEVISVSARCSEENELLVKVKEALDMNEALLNRLDDIEFKISSGLNNALQPSGAENEQL